jgi:RimJ/RimL family protein N-acetyltransferase
MSTTGDTSDTSDTSDMVETGETGGLSIDTTLTDGVVTLRPISKGDIDQITLACQDLELQRYIPVPRPYHRSDAEAYVALSHDLWPSGRKYVFTVVAADDPQVLLGVISLTVAGRCGNAAYWLTPAARGRHTASRSLRLLAGWAFKTLLLAVILLEIHDTNEASKRVAVTSGFHHSGDIEVATDEGPKAALLYVRLASDRPPHPRPS